MIKEIINLIRSNNSNEEEELFDDRMTEKIYIRVTPQEKVIVKKLAKINSLKTSQFVRHLIFTKYINDFIKG